MGQREVGDAHAGADQEGDRGGIGGRGGDKEPRSRLRGGGRQAKEDQIDPRVGVTVHRRIGETVRVGERLADVHAAHAAAEFVDRVRECFVVEDAAAPQPQLVLERID